MCDACACRSRNFLVVKHFLHTLQMTTLDLEGFLQLRHFDPWILCKWAFKLTFVFKYLSHTSHLNFFAFEHDFFGCLLLFRGKYFYLTVHGYTGSVSKKCPWIEKNCHHFPGSSVLSNHRCPGEVLKVKCPTLNLKFGPPPGNLFWNFTSGDDF